MQFPEINVKNMVYLALYRGYFRVDIGVYPLGPGWASSTRV